MILQVCWLSVLELPRDETYEVDGEDNDIELTVVYPGDKKWKTSKIERVHRTLKELFQKWFSYTGKTVWYDMLDVFVTFLETKCDHP